MSDDGFGLYDYDSYDDYYFYYEDKYADFEYVYAYFFWISSPLRDVILSNDAEEVFTSLAPTLMGLANAMPIKTTLKLLKTAMKDLKKSLEAGAMEPLHYWLRPIERGQFRFANFAPHLKGKCHFHFLIQ